MHKIAIIPARGGSKRLPRKNILPVCGKPLIFYPINSALRSNLFDRVVVSTEDMEIREVALAAGAEVIIRPDELSADRSTVVQVCEHALDALYEKNKYPEFFCCIYATAIFISTSDIENSYNIFQQEPETDVVMGISDYNLQVVQALEEINGYLKPKWPEYIGKQSQFQPKLLGSNGTLYWARTMRFLKNLSFYCERLKGYWIPKYRAIDIDTKEDFDFANILAEALFKSGG